AGIRTGKNVPPLKTALAKLAKAVSFVPIIGGAVKEAIYGKIGSADYLAAGDMRPILVRVVNEDLEPLLNDIKNETLLIWGDGDTATPLEAGRKINAGIPNSRLEIIEGAGHYAFADRPEEFYGLLEDFLKSSPGRDA
ncbi:MAG: alpha/beta hydrolase, partial [Nitrospinota bacterium]